MCRFYPGLVAPNFSAIGPGSSQSSGKIGAPEGEMNADQESDIGGKAKGGNVPAARATHVVGSLDHPVLPAPPVRAFRPADLLHS